MAPKASGTKGSKRPPAVKSPAKAAAGKAPLKAAAKPVAKPQKLEKAAPKATTKSVAAKLLAKATTVVAKGAAKAAEKIQGKKLTKAALKAAEKAAAKAAEAPVEKALKKPGKLGAKEMNAKEKSAAAIKAAEAIGEKLCREPGCENYSTTKAYCRLHYIMNWKKIKRKEMILREGKLNQYIEELVSKYPDKYIEIIREDLSSETSFNKVIHDLELDESIDDLDYDGDSIDSLIGSIGKSAGDVDDGDF